MIVIWIGYGLTLIGASLLASYKKFQTIGIVGAIAAIDFALFALVVATQAQWAEPEFIDRAFLPGLDRATLFGLIKVLCWCLAAVVFLLVSYSIGNDGSSRSRRMPFLSSLPVVLVSVVLTGSFLGGKQFSWSAFSKFVDAISSAFNPHQYGLPVFAGLLLLGLSLVFLASLLLGREKPHLGLALAVFAIMPLHSVMSHWSDNEQRGHLFGYWFGHDMFTPPFVDAEGKFSYDAKKRAEAMKDPAKAKLTYPEMTRDAILYGGTDPGRFCPTYIIFCESFIPARCKPLDPVFDRRDVYIITQNALADGTYLEYIRSHYNKSEQVKYDTPFFQEIFRPGKERADNYRTNTLARLANSVLDRPFLSLGEKIEKRRRAEGVYPPKEMYIATPQDSQRCFQEYMEDAQRRMAMNQLRPGEDVRVNNGRLQVSGQVAVMAINGLLTKVMFDKNPTNEFFVEESFPLEWMFPHLTPFGVIMKINRQPMKELPEEVMERDHAFWAKYSERLIGNWITYDTPVKEIVDFVEKVYLRRDFSGFKGDPKFVRDDQAQKAFSKLRSSIGGIYAWRLGQASMSPTPAEYLPKSAAVQQRLMKEADFTFKQAFAFCPYSPEAVFRYMQVLLSANRLEDAILIVQTALKLDPYNDQLARTLKQLEGFRGNAGKISEAHANIEKLQAEWRKNPTQFQTGLNLAGALFSVGQNAAGEAVLNEILTSPAATSEAILAVAQYYAQAKNYLKLEEVLARLTEITPSSPEAWYDLAALRASLGKTPEALASLKRSLELGAARAKTNAQARNLKTEAGRDPRFQGLNQTPEFKALLGSF
jgi:tetratricopeptide (TPR) repeat protein